MKSNQYPNSIWNSSLNHIIQKFNKYFQWWNLNEKSIQRTDERPTDRQIGQTNSLCPMKTCNRCHFHKTHTYTHSRIWALKLNQLGRDTWMHSFIYVFFCLYLTITSWNFNLNCFSIISEGRHARLKKNLFEFELIYLTFHIESNMVLSVVMFGEVCVFACYITKYLVNRSTAFPSIEIHSRLTLLLATSDLKCPKASVIMNANRRCLTHYTFVQ